MPTPCTCRPGRDHDGSEFGLCSYCEDAERRDLLEAFAEGEPRTLEELEDEDTEMAL